MAGTHRIQILRNVYQKLDGMMLSFGMPMYNDNISDDDIERYVGMSLNDTMRELRLENLDTIKEMSIAEYHIENRCVYHKLRSLRNSASIFFKFSTSVDGKTVDKSMIPKMINEMIIDNIIFDGKIETEIISLIESLNIEELNSVVEKIDFNNKSIVILKK